MGPNGIPYFYNAVTKQSTWERPAELAPPLPPTAPPPKPQEAPKTKASGPVESSSPANPDDGNETRPEVDQEEAPENAADSTDDKAQGDKMQTETNEPAPEVPVSMKKLPNCPWAIVLTSDDNEFFVNLETKESTWEMPDDIGELIGQILAAPAPMDDDEGEEAEEAAAEAGQQVDVTSSEQPMGVAGFKRKLEGDTDDRNAEAKTIKLSSKRLILFLVYVRREISDAAFLPSHQQLLREKDVSPFTTWERELPKIIHDDRYGYVNAKERKQLFEHYCKVRVAELHEEKKNKSKDAKDGFHKLLEEMVNYRTTWEDFARRYRKDARFLAVSEDRERRAAFNEFLNQKKVERVKQKREEKQKLTDEFNDLLAECAIIGPKTLWREARKEIENDPRYLALQPADREELFYTYRKKLEDEEKYDMEEDQKERKERERKAREAASLKEREEAVRRQMEELDRETRSKKNRLLREDSETTYKSILIDNIRNHDVTWQQIRTEIEKDHRWDQCRLPENELRRLFEEHVTHIFTRRLAAFNNLVDETASLTSTFDEVSDIITRDPRSQQLRGWTSATSGPYVASAEEGEDSAIAAVRKLFQRRQRERLDQARQNLEDALKENKFIMFHVRNAVQSAHVEAVEKGQREADVGDEWRLINLDEIKQVLEDNKAYNDYEAFQQERDRIVFAYVKSLVEKVRGEKGGVLDNTIAAHAGGHFEDKDKYKR
ncbi:transcription elongation regulator [Phlyctochytrium bullatum]|nr:transcription elongation regulator [Phlyctochytrium bullatum]